MEISLRTHGLECTDELKQMVQRSVDFAADRHKASIDRISVYLADINGPRGGIDKLCQIIVHLPGTEPIMIVEQGSDLVPAINRAVGRVAYRVGQHVHRRRIAGAPEHRETIRAV